MQRRRVLRRGLRPGPDGRQGLRAVYYLALLAVFAFGLYLAIDSGAFG